MKEVKPLEPSEQDLLLRLLLRESETSDSETVRRNAKSLFSILARETYE